MAMLTYGLLNNSTNKTPTYLQQIVAQDMNK